MRRSTRNLNALRRRAEIIKTIREYFQHHGYLEVETPILTPALIPESSIHHLSTIHEDFEGKDNPLYLVPSPELWMKRLLSEGSGNIFQISKSFRNREERSRLHAPEFTMLEWYTTDTGYLDSIVTTEELLAELSKRNLDGNAASDLHPPFQRLSVQEAFSSFGKIDLAECKSREDMIEQAKNVSVKTDPDDTWEEAFNRVFLSLVEPNLPRERALVLYDYPRQIPCLAQAKPNSPWSERWELYARGVEIANCFTEERDPLHLKRFYEEEVKVFLQAERPINPDTELIEMIEKGFPRCSGVALGLDRLIMLLLDADGIEDVTSYQA